MTRARRIAALAVIAFLVAASAAFAATLQVTTDAESGPGSLGDTILHAGPGDTIEVPAGTYPLTDGATLIAQGNILHGAGADLTTIVPTGGGDALTAANVVDATIAAPEHPNDSTSSTGTSSIEPRAQVIAVVVVLAIFLLILDLVRRRRLVERYALLWMGAAFILLVLSIWTGGLDVLADVMGIQLPANAIFILAFAMIFLLLLNFSVATSRLSEETKILAQESARLEQELRALRGESGTANGSGPPPGAEDEQDEAPVTTEDRT
jgi:hypothetical protein